MLVAKARGFLLPALLAVLLRLPVVFGHDRPFPWARIFASDNGLYGSKVLVAASLQGISVRGCLFRLDSTGHERMLWDKALDFVPATLLVSNRGHVVAINQYPDLDILHALVVFGESGRLLADYAREDLPTADGSVRELDSACSWSSEASFSFEYVDWPRLRTYLRANLRNGAVITVDLSTGRLVPAFPWQADVQGWPRELAGRRLQGIGEYYALYAVNSRDAGSLGHWLDSELENAASRFGLPHERGLILAIDAGEEPMAALAEWRSKNVDRSRPIDWQSDRVGPFGFRKGFRGDEGRPYCLGTSNPAYFTESYEIPYDDAVEIGVIDPTVIGPTWVCVLTTDSHSGAVFDSIVTRTRWEGKREAMEVAREVIRRHPSQLLVYWIFSIEAAFLTSEYRSIDRELMHLQRREVLWQSLIKRSPMDEDSRTALLNRVRSGIDDAWKKLFLSRPTD